MYIYIFRSDVRGVEVRWGQSSWWRAKVSKSPKRFVPSTNGLLLWWDINHLLSVVILQVALNKQNKNKIWPNTSCAAVKEEQEKATVRIFQQQTWHTIHSQQGRVTIQGALLGNPDQFAFEAVHGIGRFGCGVQDPGQQATFQHPAGWTCQPPIPSSHGLRVIQGRKQRKKIIWIFYGSSRLKCLKFNAWVFFVWFWSLRAPGNNSSSVLETHLQQPTMRWSNWPNASWIAMIHSTYFQFPFAMLRDLRSLCLEPGSERIQKTTANWVPQESQEALHPK